MGRRLVSRPPDSPEEIARDARDAGRAADIRLPERGCCALAAAERELRLETEPVVGR